MQKQNINILVVIRWPVGGIRTFFRYVYRQFDPLVYYLTIIAPDLKEMMVLLDDLKGFRVKYIAISSKPSIKELIGAVWKTVKTNRYDLIHSQGYTSGVCSIIGSVLTRTPHILTSHDVFRGGQFVGMKGILKKNALSMALPMIDIIHSVSHDAQDNLLAYLSFLKRFKKKLVAIPNGIETERFLKAPKRDLRKELNLPHNSFLIGFLGRIMSQKGFIYLVDAMELILKRNHLPKKPLILTFGGGGFIREERAGIKKRGLDDYFLFLPFAPNVASTLKGLDVVVMPSLWEACGLLAMEAMVSGVPFIGSDCIGLREVLKDTPCKIVPSACSRAIADAVLDEMRSPSIKIAQSFVDEATKRFDVRQQSKDLEAVMSSLLE